MQLIKSACSVQPGMLKRVIASRPALSRSGSFNYYYHDARIDSNIYPFNLSVAKVLKQYRHTSPNGTAIKYKTDHCHSVCCFASVRCTCG